MDDESERDILRGMEDERDDLSMTWDEYILYLLEVDRSDVNDDCLRHLSEVVGRD